jgi:hypothetical protein
LFAGEAPDGLSGAVELGFGLGVFSDEAEMVGAELFS